MGGTPALRPGAIAQSPGREAALAWASPAQRSPASSVLAREGASCTGRWILYRGATRVESNPGSSLQTEEEAGLP